MPAKSSQKGIYTEEAVASMLCHEIARVLQSNAETIAQLEHRLEWFKRQLFGKKSERFAPEPDPQQMHLGQILGEASMPPSPDVSSSSESTVPTHTRRKPKSDFADDAQGSRFFDELKVPVQRIEVPNPEADGLAPEQYEVVGEKVSHRLAQRPGSYVVLAYVRPVIKRLDTQTLHCPPAPAGVLEGSRADVSFLAGTIIDKFAYHLPLYRVHQRCLDSGLNFTRPWLTQLTQKSIALLEPIAQAQLASICSGRVIAMDEIPIKAGLAGKGEMKKTYFWPVYGDQDEVCFPHFESRRHEHVAQVLGTSLAKGTVLLTDGYGAYESYAKATGIRHAQCWAHSRRKFFEAKDAEPEDAADALLQIAALYRVEDDIREEGLTGQAKHLYRLVHSAPIVDKFFDWVRTRLARHGFLPSNPLVQALTYVRDRFEGLRMFLADPKVAVDTNHLERSLRPIAMGRRNWSFCWTEVGAKHAGVAQSLIVTCRLQGVDPYAYLVDVLQRVGQHPASKVHELTPRLWKQHFAQEPLRSDLDRLKS